jgi:hypothetical protein
MQLNFSTTKHEDDPWLQKTSPVDFMQTKYVFIILIGLTMLMLFAAELLSQVVA